MARFRVLALSHSKHPDGSKRINQRFCMLERLNKSDDVDNMPNEVYKGHQFYALFPEMLTSDWLRSATHAIRTNNSKTKFIVVKRG